MLLRAHDLDIDNSEALNMSYTAPPQRITFDGFLFDMDGTIIDSTEAVVKHWQT